MNMRDDTIAMLIIYQPKGLALWHSFAILTTSSEHENYNTLITAKFLTVSFTNIIVLS